MSDLINWLIGAVWGGTMFLSWTYVLRHRWGSYSLHHDDRSRRALLTGFASWVTAALFSSAYAASLLIDVTDVGITIRGLLFALGLGAFTGAGVLSALETRRAEG